MTLGGGAASQAERRPFSLQPGKFRAALIVAICHTHGSTGNPGVRSNQFNQWDKSFRCLEGPKAQAAHVRHAE